MTDFSRYCLTLNGKRGIRLRPLAFRPKPDPIAGESIKGLVTRAAVRNGFTSIAKVLRLADIKTKLALSTTQIEAAGRLAYVLKVPEDAVESRMYPYVVRPDAHSEFLSFHGVILRSLYLERCRRRVSPRALASSPHHRAIHDIRVFSFCPETMEPLIDTCPACSKSLGWFRTRGVQFCEYCLDGDDNPTVDLRDFPQPLIEVNDQAGLSVITGLVNPDPNIREKALASCDPALRHLGPGDLFELAVILVRALKTPASGYRNQLVELKNTASFSIFEPEYLSRIGRALINWSSGFDSIADELRSHTSERKACAGLFKELGALHAATVYRRIPFCVKSVLQSAIALNMRRTADIPAAPRRKVWRHRTDLIDSLAVASLLRTQKGGVVSKLARSGLVAVQRGNGDRQTVLFLKSEIEAIAAVRSDMIEGRKAARYAGLPLIALEALADSNAIERADGPATFLAAGSIHYRRSSLDQFLDGIRVAAKSGSVPVDARALDSTLRSLPGPRPWVAIIRAIEAGTLPVAEVIGTGPLFSRLRVDRSKLQEIVNVGVEMTVLKSEDEPRDYREVAGMLRTARSNISRLVESGLLRRISNDDARISSVSIREFSQKFVLTPEIADHLSTSPRRARIILLNKGLKPVFTSGPRRICVWRRAEVLGTQSIPSDPSASDTGDKFYSNREASRVLGASPTSVPSLISMGLLESTGEFACGITSSALARFSSQFVLASEVADRFQVPLRHVRQFLISRGIKPIFESRRGRPFVWRRDEVSRCAVVPQLSETEKTKPPGMSQREAALYLGTTTPNVCALIANGLLEEADGSYRRITTDAIEQFNRRFVFTPEVARHFAVHPSLIRRVLADRGIFPVCALGEGVRFVWGRSVLGVQLGH